MRSFGIPDKLVIVIAGIYGDSECAVLGLGHEEGNSRQEKRDKVEFTTVLEDLDLAGSIALLSSKFHEVA